MSRSCFVLLVFYVVGLLLFAIFLRDTNHHLFYQSRVLLMEAEQLRQALWQKQLKLESMMSPGTVLPALESTEGSSEPH